MNRGGREIEIAPSAAFEVANDGDAPRAALFARRGELWLADSGEVDCDPPEARTARSTCSAS